jgi:hypothetical protein
VGHAKDLSNSILRSRKKRKKENKSRGKRTN